MKIEHYTDISRSDFLRNTKYCMADENYAKHEIIWGFGTIFAEDSRHKPCKSRVPGFRNVSQFRYGTVRQEDQLFEYLQEFLKISITTN
jgi:hypothetical protein